MTSIKKNATIKINDKGEKVANISFSAHRPQDMAVFRKEFKPLEGYMLRYIYFIDKKCRSRLTVPEIPFTKIDEIGAGMYKSQRISRAERHSKLSAAQITNNDVSRETSQ